MQSDEENILLDSNRTAAVSAVLHGHTLRGIYFIYLLVAYTTTLSIDKVIERPIIQ
jgi:hypothetical protein